MKEIQKKKIRTGGITLIALVITVIVLLILAGVTVATLTGENGLINNATTAEELTNKNTGKEILITKIYDYKTQEISQNKKTTLEGLKEYLKDDNEIEYINLQQSENQNVYAIIKLKEYDYEYILNSNLDFDDIDKESLNKEVKIDDELQKLLDEANMTITLEDILNTPEIMRKVNGLIPTLTENNITINNEEGVVSYKDTTGGIIRISSEQSSDPAWQSFDDNINTATYSEPGEAAGYYLEYEFKEEKYAMQIKFSFGIGSKYEGTRVIVIQGYDETGSKWEDITGEMTITGNDTTMKSQEKIERLNYDKTYRRYRIYVKSATYTSNANGGKLSGLYEMQLYGVDSSKIKENSEENLKKALLSNSNIDIITLNDMISNTEFIKKLINALSVKTVQENEVLMEHLPSLIPTLTANDITINNEEGVVSYKDTTGGIIRISSELSSDSAWQSFDDNINTATYSEPGEAAGYYLEYEFKEEKYAMQIKFSFGIGSKYEGTRVIVIQGYDETGSKWEDITGEMTITGNDTTMKSQEKIERLNYDKTYRRYRIYVKSATYTSNANGGKLSGLYEMQLYGKNANH